MISRELSATAVGRESIRDISNIVGGGYEVSLDIELPLNNLMLLDKLIRSEPRNLLH